jgi:hypothetical protein
VVHIYCGYFSREDVWNDNIWGPLRYMKLNSFKYALNLVVSVTILGDVMFKMNNTRILADNCKVFTFKNINLLISF